MLVTYHPGAEADLIDAARFYDGRVPGLGDRFLAEFDAAVATIGKAPERWRVVERDLRRYTMRRFPYAIYYRVLGEELRILIVKHHRRHPDYGRDRLDS
jgi:plasmid stabilization system protein ParE